MLHEKREDFNYKPDVKCAISHISMNKRHPVFLGKGDMERSGS